MFIWPLECRIKKLAVPTKLATVAVIKAQIMPGIFPCATGMYLSLSQTSCEVQIFYFGYLSSRHAVVT